MIISSGMFACSNNVSENAGCFWNEYLDSLYTNYLCALNSECVDYEGHREDVVYSLPHTSPTTLAAKVPSSPR